MRMHPHNHLSAASQTSHENINSISACLISVNPQTDIKAEIHRRLDAASRFVSQLWAHRYKGSSPTHTVTGKILLAAVMVMQVLNTTCSQWPCSTQSSEFQDKGRVKVMFISSWASRPAQREHNRLLHHKTYCCESHQGAHGYGFPHSLLMWE